MTRKEQVLKYVNDLRAEYGIGEPLDELPKGYRHDPFHCPVARAVNGEASIVRVGIGTPQGQVDVVPPMYVRRFIDTFDRGEYPELVVEE